MSPQHTRIAVTVTFLRQDAPPLMPAPKTPHDDATLTRVAHPSVAFYRYLYDTVGAPYVWWLRRTMPDAEIAALMADPQVSLHVLYRGGEPAGFFELHGRGGGPVNLAYFGLMPQAVGVGLGTALLRAAVDEAWRRKPTVLTVNTCTADHPRALPNYLRAGFRVAREVREIWDVPNRLGLHIPAQLKV
jgi:GNAT superfamily N-acetyltransferase